MLAMDQMSPWKCWLGPDIKDQMSRTFWRGPKCLHGRLVQDRMFADPTWSIGVCHLLMLWRSFLLPTICCIYSCKTILELVLINTSDLKNRQVGVLWFYPRFWMPLSSLHKPEAIKAFLWWNRFSRLGGRAMPSRNKSLGNSFMCQVADRDCCTLY